MSEEAHAHPNYVKVWAWLVVLLVISVLGPMLEIPAITLITAFGIACVKAYMVAKNFMHLDVEKPIVHWVLATAVILMVLLFAGVAPDVMKDDGHRWKKDAGFHAEAAAGHGAGAGAHDAPDGHGAEATDHPEPAAEPGADGGSEGDSH